MVALEIALKNKARHKFSLATLLHPLQLDQTIQPSNKRRRTRCFKRTAQRNTRIPTRNDVNDQEVTTEVNLPDLNPINLTSSELTDAECSLLKKGPAFFPEPKDVNWQNVTDEMDTFERRIRLAVSSTEEMLKTTHVRRMIDFQPFHQLPNSCLQNPFFRK